jgi:hypothetical protein
VLFRRFALPVSESDFDGDDAGPRLLSPTPCLIRKFVFERLSLTFPSITRRALQRQLEIPQAEAVENLSLARTQMNRFEGG